MNQDLKNFKVAVLATDGFEETELTSPVKALRETGADVDVIALKPGTIQGFKHFEKGLEVKVDKTIAEVDPENYQGLVLPGGAMNADQMRAVKAVRQFVQSFDVAGKPIAVICHAAWILASAGILEGRELTSWPSIKDDLINAGADWFDQEVRVNDNLVSSRKPEDLPAFNREMIRLFEEERKSDRGKSVA